MKKNIALIGLLSTTLMGFATSAQATIIFSDRQSGNPDQQVLFNQNNGLGETAPIGGWIDGYTNNTNTPVFYTSSTSALHASGGQADITACNGSCADSIKSLTWVVGGTMASPGGPGWTEERFNIETNANTNVHMVFYDQNNTAFSYDHALSANGNNWFTITTADGESILMATFTTDAAINNFQQDRLTLSAAVPEPSTWAMMLLGFAGLSFAGYRRNRRRAPSIA